MSTSLRERAANLRKQRADEEANTPASAEEEAEPVEPEAEADAAEDTPDTEAEAEAPEVEDDADVISIVERASKHLSDEEIEAILESNPLLEGVAELTLTRTTKTGQSQYDGKTVDGYVVRVWAPEGADPITAAELSSD